MLQVLAAHWRLLEKKSYYTAAWLFLLSRVVHRALINEDEQDEEGWSSQGIDILVRLTYSKEINSKLI
jgi:conserved oligomeric Golgi complex subunit 1